MHLKLSSVGAGIKACAHGLFIHALGVGRYVVVDKWDGKEYY